MPEAVLSAVVFLIGLGLIDIAGMRTIYAQARSEFWVALITAAVVAVVGVETENIVIVKADQGGWRTQPVTDSGQFEPGREQRCSFSLVRRPGSVAARGPLRTDASTDRRG
jgi:hypothetical protein